MDVPEFDRALVASVFELAAHDGWRSVTVAEAARAAGLPLAKARLRFPSRATVLLRLGRMADEAALELAAAEGAVKDRLFDLLMRRFDVLQAHRQGVLALLRVLPLEPSLALMLALATHRSMRWMLDAAGIDPSGLNGELHVKGLVGVWLWVVRAWRADDSSDLAATMAALDAALDRAGQASQWFPSASRGVASVSTAADHKVSAPAGAGSEPEAEIQVDSFPEPQPPPAM